MYIYIRIKKTKSVVFCFCFFPYESDTLRNKLPGYSLQSMAIFFVKFIAKLLKASNRPALR